ncbi:MAG: protein kinase [Limisphaerales bacterium]
MAADPPSSLRDIFLEAAELNDPAAREAYLCRVCGNDTALRARVDALLAADAACPGADVIAEASPAGARSIPLPPRTPERIGRYRILESIGEGGCGTVFLAQQDEPVKRRVALKVIKLGMDTRQVVARFEAERQALAMMDHPNIARVLDTGATDSGQPFFVMEWVRGTRITEFGAAHRLDLRQRIELFLEVCQAVHHAHQKGIIHRDLKPSNVLIAQPEGSPLAAPKVIDFGIAKAIAGRLTDATLYTANDQIMGTPAYMSPEQAAGGGTDVDTRADIYSLGVLLYEMLTGQTPFESRDLLARGLDEMRRTIREVEPERPSAKVRTAKRTNISKGCAKEGPSLDATPGCPDPLPDDLDWVVMKCLEKDRTRRCETVNGLMQDLRRWLKQEAVTARPPTAAYRIQKWVYRNRIVFAAACAVILTLLGGVAVSSVMYVREARARGEVEVQRAAAERQRREFQQRSYASDMKIAQQSVSAFDLRNALDILERHRPATPGMEDLRGFEWRYLWQLCQGSPHEFLPDDVGMPWILTASPDGKFFAAAFDDGRDAGVTVWSLETREPVVRLESDANLDGDSAGAVFSGDGRWLATACHYRVKFFEVGTWRELSELTLTNASGPIDLRADTLVTTAVGHMRDPTRLDGLVVWNLPTRTSTTISNVTGPPTLSHDGKRLALRSEAGLEIRRVDDLGSSPLLLESSRGLLAHGSGYGSLKREMAFSPDGRRIAAAGLANDRGDLPVIVWDASSGRRIDGGRLIGHLARVHGLAWSADSRRIATAGADGTIRVWDAEGRTEPILLTGHLSEPWCVTFVPGRNEIISSSIVTGRDPVKVWRLDQLDSQPESTPEWYPLWLSRDGSEVLSVTGTADGIFRDRRSGRVLQHLFKPAGIPPDDSATLDVHVIGTDQMQAAFVGYDNGQVASWFVGSSQFPRLLRAHDGAVRAIASMPTRGLILTGGDDHTIRWWRLDTGQLIRSNRLDYRVTALAASPDGQTFISALCEPGISGHRGRQFQLAEWEAASGRLLSTQSLPGLTIRLGLSPDGKWLAACVSDAQVGEHTHLLDRGTRTWRARLDQVGRRLDFSPDGSHLLIWSRLWDLRTDPPTSKVLTGHRQRLMQQTFSPDSRTVVSTSDDGTVRLWSVATGQEMLISSERGRSFSFPVFSGDGTTLVVGSFTMDGLPLRFWHAPTLGEIDARIREGRVNR